MTQKPDVIPQAADHVASVRGHRRPAVQLDLDAHVLRLGQLVARDDPRPERGESVEALADVARVLAAASAGVALADVPADGVAEHVVERLSFAHAARARADDRAQLGLVVHVFRELRQEDGAARADDRRGRLEEELGHQVVLAEPGAIGAAGGSEHLRRMRLVVCRGGPDRRRVLDRGQKRHRPQRKGFLFTQCFARALHGLRLVGERLDDFLHGVAPAQMARGDERRADWKYAVLAHGTGLVLVILAEFHGLPLHCKLRAMLNPIGLTHGHYECRALDETLPIFTDLLAMQVLERGKGQAVVRHPNTPWRLVVHEGGPDAPDKPHNNHYGVRVARPAEVDAAHEYLEANKARYGLKRVSRPSAQHFARSIYFSEPGGNTLEIEYYDPQAAAEGRGIAAPHWQRELAESAFPGRGYVPQALTHGTLECHDKDASAAFYRDVRSEEHTSELQSLAYLVCRLLLEKKKK